MKKINWPKNPWVYLIALLVLVTVFNIVLGAGIRKTQTNTVEYSTFLQMVAQNRVASVRIGPEEISFTTVGANALTEGHYKTKRIDDIALVERLNAAGVTFSAEEQGSSTSILSIIVTFILPIAFYGLVIFWFVKLIRGGGGGGLGAMSFGKSSARLYSVSDSSKKFSDVAGQDEAKEALIEMVDFLHQPDKYKRIGAKLPKGALLVGPPGTGKTLIAQAVAGEAGVPFFFVSGSSFVEMFVGTGAARVRDLFKQASEKAPCIVFIDEIDAIGKKRDVMGVNANDEREQALNQLLAEMDGFDPGKGIVVLGATNRPEILDRALLRPGRFDRRITVDLPDLHGREAVLRVHSRDVSIGQSANLAAIARATVGASGADLANIINEAALHAVRVGHIAVEQSDLESAVDTVIAGSERKSLVIPEKEKRMIACHEIGHALVAARQKHAAPVHKITIIPRTSGALGFTMQVDEDEHVLQTREELIAKLVVLAAGREAEKFMFHTMSTGASNDIDQMTKLARSMVTRFGMSDRFGMMALETAGSAYLGEGGQLACSFDTATEIDKEVEALIAQSCEAAARILRDNADQLAKLSAFLLERENITGDEFMELIGHENDPSKTIETNAEGSDTE